MGEEGALTRAGDFELSNLVESNLIQSFHQEHLVSQSQGIYSVSSYNKLCRILSAVGYEVVVEGKPAEQKVLHQGRAHARIDGNNFEVLLESRFEPKSTGMALTEGYTYFRLEGPAEYARFIKDYETVVNYPHKNTFFFGWGVSSAIIAGILAGGMGLMDLAIPQSIPWWFYALSFPAGAVTTSTFAKTIETGAYQEDVKKFYDGHKEHQIVSGGKHALLRALHLPEEKKDGGKTIG